jgi:hypothetical protein
VGVIIGKVRKGSMDIVSGLFSVYIWKIYSIVPSAVKLALPYLYVCKKQLRTTGKVLVKFYIAEFY